MAKRNKIKARALRSFLKHELGGVCKMAHKSNCKGVLTFDCIIPMGHDHHRGSTDQRMDFYIKQHLKHNIQLLCEKHNAQKKARTDGLVQHKPKKEEESNPF